MWWTFKGSEAQVHFEIAPSVLAAALFKQPSQPTEAQPQQRATEIRA